MTTSPSRCRRGSCAPPCRACWRRTGRTARARVTTGRARPPEVPRKESGMARILLVDNESEDRLVAARALGVREQEIEQVESLAAALVRAAESGHQFVLVSPAVLEASLATR